MFSNSRRSALNFIIIYTSLIWIFHWISVVSYIIIIIVILILICIPCLWFLFQPTLTLKIVLIIALLSFLELNSEIGDIFIVSVDVIIRTTILIWLKFRLRLILLRWSVNIWHLIFSLRLTTVSIFTNFYCILYLFIAWRRFWSILNILTTGNVSFSRLKIKFTHAVRTLLHVRITQLIWNLFW
jgi:hypothetical protein